MKIMSDFDIMSRIAVNNFIENDDWVNEDCIKNVFRKLLFDPIFSTFRELAIDNVRSIQNLIFSV